MMGESGDIVGLKIRSALIITVLTVVLLGMDFYFSTEIGCYALVFAAVSLGLLEFCSLSRAKGGAPLPALAIASAMCLLLVQIVCIREGISLIYAISGTVTAVLLATIIGYMFTSQTRTYFNDVGAAVLGLLYVWFLGGFFFIGLRHLPGGFWAVFLTIATVKSGDAIAYAIGRKFGRHKLIPRISPKKSYEGAAAGIAGATAATVLINHLLAAHNLAVLSTSQAVVFGIAVSIAGIVGDLIESNFKRSAEIKDSSHLIAWYGGVLDLVDSLLVGSPVAYFLFVIYGS